MILIKFPRASAIRENAFMSDHNNCSPLHCCVFFKELFGWGLNSGRSLFSCGSVFMYRGMNLLGAQLQAVDHKTQTRNEQRGMVYV